MGITSSTSQKNVINDQCKIGNQYNNIESVSHYYVNYNQENVKVEDVADKLPKPPKLIRSFQGREKQMEQLKDLLFKKKMVTICGLPGFGKSELAKQFAQMCKDEETIKIICWIQATTEDNLQKSFRDLAKILKLPEVEDNRNRIQMITNCFIGTRTLFIIDDAESRQSLIDCETPSGCYCLVTSQENDWGDDIPSLRLLALDTDAAVDVLLLNSHHKDTSLLRELALVLECVPLALQLAAAYIREEENDLRDKFNLELYVKKLSREEFVSQDVPRCSSLPYKNSIASAINITVMKLNKLGCFKAKLALDIIHVCAYLNPFVITEKSILEFPYIQKTVHKIKKENIENEVRRALSLLDNYSLLYFDSNTPNTFLQIHGLVQSTLIFNHKNDNAKNNPYYFSCLEYILKESCKVHLHFVLKHADINIETFSDFYRIYKSVIISQSIRFKFKKKNSEMTKKKFYFVLLCTFFGALVSTNSEVCLNYIFNDLDKCARDIIDKYFLLILATSLHNSKLLEVMLKYGGDVNIKEPFKKCTLLHLAAYELDLDCINLLLEHNINVSKTDRSGNSVLWYVFDGINSDKIDNYDIVFDIINILINKGADICVNENSTTILHLAVSYNLKLVEFIIDKFKIDINRKDLNGSTPLHYVVVNPSSHLFTIEPSSESVDLMMEEVISNYFGVDFGAKSFDYKNTEIDYKITIEIMSTLIARGANVNCSDAQGYTILHLAVLTRNILLTEYIIDQLNADLNIKCRSGYTPLHSIFTESWSQTKLIFDLNSKKDEGLINALVSRGADICNFEDGLTILHGAVNLSNVKLTTFIIDTLHVDVNIKSHSQHTPLDFIIEMLHKKQIDGLDTNIIRVLINRGGQLQFYAKHGYTILHHAVVLSNVKLVEFSIDKLNVGVNLQTDFGQTPLDLAIIEKLKLSRATNEASAEQKKKNNKIVESLKSRGARLNTTNK